MDEERVRQLVRHSIYRSLGLPEAIDDAIATAVEASEGAAPAPRETDPRTRTIAIGADHGGFPLKEALRKHLLDHGYTVRDCGSHSSDPIDYPDIAFEVARQVSQGSAWRGVMIDGAGIGSAMVANKVPGVRAALCYDLSTAKNAREHNDANMLTLGGRLIGVGLAQEIVRLFLETEFGGGRHARRVEKIAEIEKRSARGPNGDDREET